MANLVTALAAADASLDDVVSMTVLMVGGIDLAASYAAAAETLAALETPPLVTAALVSALGVPGALVEVSAIAARMP
jgi:enamine deaminase RidA (YjgF/YER057c/UK114 family)